MMRASTRTPKAVARCSMASSSDIASGIGRAGGVEGKVAGDAREVGGHDRGALDAGKAD
jgi:hypothetical protein